MLATPVVVIHGLMKAYPGNLLAFETEYYKPNKMI
jgi:hypothetical protein